ncbi:MAG: hypothetical protein ABIB71_06625 [Candidatus Woesearchaeota archaeon]
MKSRIKGLLRLILKLALFIVFIGVWMYFVHEPLHYLGCSLMGQEAAYNIAFPSPSVECAGITEKGHLAAFVYWGMPYIIGAFLTVLYAIFSLGILHNKFGFVPRLFRYVIFLDVLANFFDYSNSDFHMIELNASSEFTLLAFSIVAVTVIINMILLRRDIILFKRVVIGPSKPLHHDYVATIEEVRQEFNVEKMD